MGRRNPGHVVSIAFLNLGCALDDALAPIIDMMMAQSTLVVAFLDGKRPPLPGTPIPHGFSISHSDGAFPCGFIMSPGIDPSRNAFTQHDEEGRIVSLVVHSMGTVFVAAYAPVEAPQAVNDPFWENLRVATNDCKEIKGRVHVLGDMNAHASGPDLSRYGHVVMPGTPDVYPTHTNSNGHQLLKMCLTTGMAIIPHTAGLRHTFMGAGAAPPSVTDYLLVTYKHAKEITTHATHTPPMPGSNHSLLGYQCSVNRVAQRVAKRERVVPQDNFPPTDPADEINVKYEALLAILKVGSVTPPADDVDPDIPPPILSNIESDNVRHLRAQKADAIATAASDGVSNLDVTYFDTLIKGCIAGEQVNRAAALADFLDDALLNHRYDVVYRACRQLHVDGKTKTTPASVRRSLTEHYTALLTDPIPVHLRPDITIPQTPLGDAPPKVPDDFEVEIFCDGSVSQGGVGTWAVHCPSLNIHLCGTVPYSIFGTMNWRDPMHSFGTEAWAILQALRHMPLPRIRILTDNEGCAFRVNALTSLEKTNFEGIEIPNVWRAVAAAARDMHLTATWVRGHAVEEGNRCADTLTDLAHLLPSGTSHLVSPPTATWTLGVPEDRLPALLASMVTWPTLPMPRDDVIDHPVLAPRRGDDSVPTTLEIFRAICKLRNSACGEDGVSAHTLKLPEFLQEIVAFIQEVWKAQRIPERWTRTMMASIPKTSAPMSRSNCRGISVTNIASKILTHLILARHTPPLLPQQFGSIRARGCSQAVHVVKSVIRSLRDARRSGILLFVDVRKAFDSVARYSLPAILESYGFGPIARELIHQLWQDEIILKFPDKTSSAPFKPSRGIKQGCVLSPTIFNLCIDVVLTDLQTKMPGLRCYNPSTQTFHDIRFVAYVDDLVLFADTEADATRALGHLQTSLRMVGLEINSDKGKTQYMHVNSECLPSQLSASGYDSLCTKNGSHVNAHPASNNAHIDLPTLQTSIRSDSMASRCVFADCPHVVRPDTHLRGVARGMNAHVLNRHGLNVTTRARGLQPQSTVYDPKHFLPQNKDERRDNPPGPSDVWLAGTPIEHLAKVKYLGSILTNDGSDHDDILTRAASANRAFHSVPHLVWSSPTLSARNKATIYECLVRPVLLYGAGAWTPTESSQDALTHIHLVHLRIMCGVAKFPYLATDPRDFRQHGYGEMIALAGVPHILSCARAERMRLFGQLMRASDSWLGSVSMLGKPPMAPGHAGATIASWWDVVYQDLAACGIDSLQAIHPAKWAQGIQKSLAVPP